ncbi:MAG: mechanosensitive ion channel family protein [Nanoarchaeota archaeon]|nr:mechanosensitive ion channel family protein [Nanoarchaeota archaeon]MBU1855162.1 mechanosensitive ion channel family protein [Nanoarchaeota archaeon]
MEVGIILEKMFSNGFGRFIAVILVLIFTFVFERIFRKLLGKSFDRSSKLIKVDKTQYTVLKHFLSGLIYVIGFGVAIYMIPSLRSLSVSIFAGAGVLAVIIGFASQKAFANIISGIFIAIFKPFRVGDTIKFSDRIGVVEDITLRHTVIRNFENKRFIVPNAIISDETIENYNIGDEKVCRYVEFGISYDSNIDNAMKIMQQEALKHPDFLDNRSKEDVSNGVPPVTVRVLGFGDSSVNLRAWVWAKNSGAAFRLGTDLNKSIKERFDKEGIEIPFPYRTIVFKEKKKKSIVRKK